MLPDFPEVKAALLRNISAMARTGADADPLLGLAQNQRIHEGDRVVFRREDGTEELMDFKKPLEAVVELKREDLQFGGPTVTNAAAANLAAQLHTQMAERMVEKLDQAVTAVGNVVDAGGREPSAQMLLEMLERVELTFDEDGNWDPPTMLGAPANIQKLEEMLAAASTDEGFLAAQERIVAHQRKEWHAREARRRLVD